MVDAERGEGGNATDAGDLDDVTRALLAHERDSGLGHPERTEEVGLHLGADLLLGDLLDEPELPVAGIVDDDVQPAEMRGRLTGGGLHGGLVGDVEGQRMDGFSELTDVVRQGVDVPGRRRDPVSALQGGLDELASESTRRASNEPYLAHASP